MCFRTLLWLMLTVFCPIMADSPTTESTSNLIPCKQGWFLYDKKCYKIFGETKRLNWRQAAESCSLEQGGLAVIDSPELQEYLATFLLLNTQTNPWIGLHDRVNESEFMWEDLSPVNYTNWDQYEPSGTGRRSAQEDCVEMRIEDLRDNIGKWNDLSCDRERPYFCQANESESVLSRDPRFCSVEEGEGWRYLNSCYHFVTEAKSWEDAENYCKEKFSGHLVTVLDKKTYTFLRYFFSNDSGNVWIGIKLRDEGIQVWSSGFPITYNKWDHLPGDFLPGTCVMSSKNLWTVGSCFNELPFICESSTIMKKAPNGWRCPHVSEDWIDLGGQNCYIIETNKYVSWHEADYECRTKGGNLASIHSAAESIALHPYVKNTQDGLFIGLRRSLSNNDIFEWVDGSKLDYLSWYEGEPNNIEEKCGEVWTSVMKWNDYSCSKRRGYICSAKKKPPNMEDTSTTPSTLPDLIGKNVSACDECLCPLLSNITEKYENISTSATEDPVCPSGTTTEAVAVTVVCVLLVEILIGVVVYHSRKFYKRRHKTFTGSSYTASSLSHISSEIILQPEESEYGIQNTKKDAL